MPMPMPTPRSLFLLLLLATPFFLLLPHTSSTSSPDSASLPDVDLNYLIENTRGDALGSNDPEDWLEDDEDQELFAAADDSPKEDPEVVNEAHVVILTAANFSSFLAVRRHVMVDFYAPWGYWCRKLAPEYAAAASHLLEKGLDVALAKVDATEDHELARAHDIKGYPTVLFFMAGVPRRYTYYGERTKDAFVAWITEKLGPAVQNVTTVDEAEKIITGGKVAVLAFLDSLSGAHSDELDAASRLEDTCTIFQTVNFYQTTSPDVAKLFNIDLEAKRPSVVLLKKEEQQLTVYDGEFIASAIAEFVSANKITYHRYTGNLPFNF